MGLQAKTLKTMQCHILLKTQKTGVMGLRAIATQKQITRLSKC